MSYSDKLKDSRWLELRQRAIDRDGGRCQFCQWDEDLHVHHTKYNGDPWNVPLSDLMTLCSDCHGNLEEHLKNILNSIRSQMKDRRHYSWWKEFGYGNCSLNIDDQKSLTAIRFSGNREEFNELAKRSRKKFNKRFNVIGDEENG